MALKCPSCGFENIAGEDRCVECFHSLMIVDLPKPAKNDSIQNVMMTAPVANLVTGKDLLVAEPKDTLDKIIKLFQKEEKGCIVIYKKKKLLGILSRRDMLRKVAGQRSDLSRITAEEIMTPNPEYVKVEDPIAFAVNKMALGGFRSVPVLSSDGSPISILSIKDVLTYLSRVV